MSSGSKTMSFIQDELETFPTASSWLFPVEPEVEIKESEKILEIADSEVEDCEPSSDSEEENSFQPVRELESVLVDKTCEVCGNLFQAFEIVSAEPHKPLLSTCETCSYYITPLVAAVYDSTDSSGYSCDICPKTFVRKDALLRHKASHSARWPFSCEMCDKSYKRHDKLTEHMRLAHAKRLKGRKDKCVSCGAIDNIITINIGENEASFVKVCEACNFLRQDQITKVSQNSSKVFHCDMCSSSFSRKDHLVRHRLSHLNVKPFECSVCKKTFSRNDRLLRHIKIHPNACKFPCRVCSKMFADQKQLKIHLSTHSKLNGRALPVKYDMCQKVIKDKAKLEDHVDSHDCKKSHVCEFCGKEFKLQGTLRAHIKVHTDPPLKCEMCGMEFSMKKHYTRHLLVHSSEKVYSCTLCAKTFRRKDKLQVHNLIHIDIRPYTCDLCNGSFKRKDKYTRHMKQVHKLVSGEETGNRLFLKVI